MRSLRFTHVLTVLVLLQLGTFDYYSLKKTCYNRSDERHDGGLNVVQFILEQKFNTKSIISDS